jgi:hypothetical protein
MESRKPSASVLAAAIVAIIGSLLAIIVISLGLLGLLFTPLPQADLPANFKAIAEFSMVLFLCVAGFGIATGINLIRLKNWARLSALVWAGLTVVFGSVALASILIITFPAVTGGAPVNMQYVKTMVAIMYGAPILVGIWWLVIFNQRSVKAQFADIGTGTGTMPAHDSPLAGKPTCPLPVAIIAGFMLFSVAGMFAIPLMHMPVFMIVYSHPLRGELGAFVFASNAVLYLAAAIGLLTLKKWSYPLIIGLTVLWMTSGIVTFLSPNFASIMHEQMAMMHLPETSAASVQVLQNRIFAVFALVPGVLILGILFYYRTRFLLACAAKESRN